jgi:hypothetical protein
MARPRESLRAALSLTQLSELTGMMIGTMTRRLGAAGIKPKLRDGAAHRYDSREALPVLYGVEKERVSERAKSQTTRKRLERARAELLEQKTRVARGELAPIDTMERALVALVTATRTRLLALPHTFNRPSLLAMRRRRRSRSPTRS